MTFLVRKIALAKWEQKEGITKEEIPAEAVSIDLRATDNELSFWKSPTNKVEEIKKVIVAIASGFDELCGVSCVWITEESLKKTKLAMIGSVGRTPFQAMEKLHIDIAFLDYDRLGVVARCVKSAFLNKEYLHLTRSEVIEIVSKECRGGGVKKEDLQIKVKTAIEKYLSDNP